MTLLRTCQMAWITLAVVVMVVIAFVKACSGQLRRLQRHRRDLLLAVRRRSFLVRYSFTAITSHNFAAAFKLHTAAFEFQRLNLVVINSRRSHLPSTSM